MPALKAHKPPSYDERRDAGKTIAIRESHVSAHFCFFFLFVWSCGEERVKGGGRERENGKKKKFGGKRGGKLQ